MQNVKKFMKVMGLEGIARSMICALSGGQWALGTEQSSVLCRVQLSTHQGMETAVNPSSQVLTASSAPF